MLGAPRGAHRSSLELLGFLRAQVLGGTLGKAFLAQICTGLPRFTKPSSPGPLLEILLASPGSPWLLLASSGSSCFLLDHGSS